MQHYELPLPYWSEIFHISWASSRGRFVIIRMPVQPICIVIQMQRVPAWYGLFTVNTINLFILLLAHEGTIILHYTSELWQIRAISSDDEYRYKSVQYGVEIIYLIQHKLSTHFGLGIRINIPELARFDFHSKCFFSRPLSNHSSWLITPCRTTDASGNQSIVRYFYSKNSWKVSPAIIPQCWCKDKHTPCKLWIHSPWLFLNRGRVYFNFIRIFSARNVLFTLQLNLFDTLHIVSCAALFQYVDIFEKRIPFRVF